MDEQRLIQRSLEGDLDAFNQLIREYQGLAFSVAYRILHDSEAAADAVQESFIKAYRALDTFKGGNFKSWLMRIVTNSCYDALRALGRRPTESLDNLPGADEFVDHLIYKGESPHEYAERQELNSLLERAIRSLPEDQLVSLVLCDVEGHSYEDIADITGVNIGTVKSRINRARRKVRDYLSRHSELLPAPYRRRSN
jgi:RNA polymerase sigma-70 factor (ECF subfamily)